VDIFDDIEKVQADCDWDEMLKEVLTTIADIPDDDK